MVEGETSFVYLDVDGVLNNTSPASAGRSRQSLEPELLANLKHALETAGGGAEIVVSSSWRRVPKMVEILCQLLEAAGCPIPVGMTESIPLPRQRRSVMGRAAAAAGVSSSRSATDRMAAEIDAQLEAQARQRVEEIRQHVKQHRPARWCAVDDLDLGKAGLADANFVRTDERIGLTKDLATEVGRRLRQEKPT